MAIDNRFSLLEFETAAELGSLNAKRLADALEMEIQDELHTVLMPAYIRIVQKLNSMGHHLTEYTRTGHQGRFTFEMNLRGWTNALLVLGLQ